MPQTDSLLVFLRRSYGWMFVFAMLGVLMARSGLAQTDNQKLTAEDYAEILQLYFQYPLLLDSGDGEGYANLFTEDGSFGDRVVGREALIEFATREPRAIRHAPLTPIIIPTAEGARGIVMNLFIDVSQSPAVITRVSQYTDTLVKTPGGWRFKTRVNGTANLLDPDFTTGEPGN